MNFKITTITAFIAVAPDGDEGIIGTRMNDVWMPLICGDLVRVEQMYPLAKAACKHDGKTFKVVQWQSGKDITQAIEALYGDQKTQG